MAIVTVDIDGYFHTKQFEPKDSKKKTDDSSRFEFGVDLSKGILPRNYTRSTRRFKLENLVITDIERIYGSYFNPIHVTGVIDTSGSLIPFFVKREKVKRLDDLIILAAKPNNEIL